jgi:hypothetical protein
MISHSLQFLLLLFAGRVNRKQVDRSTTSRRRIEVRRQRLGGLLNFYYRRAA